MKNSHQFYRARRAAVLESMRAHAGGGLALVPTAPEVARNRDSNFPYRFDSYFYYLSGFPEPEAVVALVAGPDGDKHVLFCREKNAEREIWDGFRYGPDAAKEIFGFDEAHPISALPEKLPELASDRPALFTPLGRSRRRPRLARCDASHQGRPRVEPHAAGGDDFQCRAPPGDERHAAGLARISGRGRTAARIPA